MAFHGRIHGFTYGISMKYMESHGIHGNTTALHGDTTASWYPMEIFIGLHVEFSWNVWNPMEPDVILRAPWHSMEEFP